MTLNNVPCSGLLFTSAYITSVGQSVILTSLDQFFPHEEELSLDVFGIFVLESLPLISNNWAEILSWKFSE